MTSLIQTSDQKPFNPALSGNTDCGSAAVAVDSSFAQKVWLNHHSLIHLDLLSPKGSPRLPKMLLSPAFQSSGPNAFLLSSPEPLLTLLSINRNSPSSPAGAPQMFFTPRLEDNGEDVTPEEPNHNPSPLWDGQDDSQSLFYQQHFIGKSAFPAHSTMMSQEPDDIMETCDRLSQMQTIGTLEEGMRIQTLYHVSQQAALVDQARRLEKRVLAMLGEHASRHYNHQLEGLRRKLLEVNYSPKSPMLSGEHFTQSEHEILQAAEMQEGEEIQTHGSSLSSRELQDLAHCGRAVLHEVLESLDSDATLSSSSDDEWDHEDGRGTSAALHRCHSCEWTWLKDRAELGSRWTWLQMKLTELDSQVQQLGELHQQILANKGRVVLAETQPLTDRQIQHALWTETMDLSFTAGNMQDLSSDIDMEPSSPTRLLRNIERQSAQLTQIVNSLMSPLCASPSKEPCSLWGEHQKTPYNSPAQCLSNGPQGLHKVRQKRKRACHRRQSALQMDVSCVSARTRPLLTYLKPRLFIMDSSTHRGQVLDSFLSFCSSCESSDPKAVYTDPTCPRRTASKIHPVLSLSSDTPLSLHLKNAVCGENFLQRSLHQKTDLLRQQHCISPRCKVSRCLFHRNHQPKNGRHLKSHRRESTPIRWAYTPDHHCRPQREGRRRRRCSDWPADITRWSDVFSRGDLVEESSEDTADGTPTRGTSQFPLHRRSSESIFRMDDIIIPVSLVSSVKVEKLQYKEILTPSWRKVEISPLLNKEEDEQDEGVLITDEDFSQKHHSYECSWSQSKRDRHRIRSSRTSSPSEDITEVSAADREPLLPWKRRVFPLSDEDEEAQRLLPDHQSTTFGMDQEMTSH